MRDHTSELRLAEALVETTNTLHDDFDPEFYLSRVASHCVEFLGATAAGVIFDASGAPAVAAGGHPRELALGLLGAQQSGGPCVESLGTGQLVPPVRLSVAGPAARWPEFTSLALRQGIGMTYAVPLRQRGTLLGALNVFLPVTAKAPQPEGELRLARVIADAAALGLHNHRAYSEYRILATQLQGALTSRVRIEQAKGMLAERWHTDVDEAFEALRRYARRERLVMDLVAKEVIKGTLDDEALGDSRSEPS
ncbi:GAF domain-containing protein [Streptomyces longisporoflavus]|uniref:GAF and ANTAR domain-containing protein n=1 Tax=Streptomyces longisporoflavus TaxID=28044 RepID=UPI00167D65FD|nr:GAF and ANTAR domain-containing protein [Streptomyces longisporoflavus]GGV31767.1 GAF domain-containing protein [Streptomyces longisporoflavus]